MGRGGEEIYFIQKSEKDGFSQKVIARECSQ